MISSRISHTCGGAPTRLKNCSSAPVNKLNSLSASALNVEVTVTLLRFPTLAATFFAGAGVGAGVGAAEVAVDTLFAGVPVRLGSALIVRSLPWESMIAAGNSANFVSSAVVRRVLATLKRASTAGDVAVAMLQPY